ncbi:PqqD family peptide modification chaperone [Allobranchiibius sp. CTAmp26]|uniref:PqqD family peptide modification chaperone n=1 Tax=Allobranchiibius sp. CTAmp26 TaxID=2815214 RepID=UPI001AA156AF|nr:PqqD family peptide modification chaperone [Allobranchiibius sp. CTAmp26]MBO1755200.1 hypothetical protein [Allobranchiibius sp. CTAmp26]
MRPGYIVPDGVAWVVGDDEDSHGPAVYLTQVRAGVPIALEGTAAQIWDAARLVPADEVAEEIAVATGQSTDAVRHSVESFLAELIVRGLLQVREPDSGGLDG